MTLYCGKCGAKRDARSTFCIKCGQEFKAPLKEEEGRKAEGGGRWREWLKSGRVKRLAIIIGGLAAVIIAVVVVFKLAGRFKAGGEEGAGDISEASPLTIVAWAKATAEAGDYDAGIKMLNDALAQRSGEGVFYWYLGDLYEMKGDFKAEADALAICAERYKEDATWGPAAKQRAADLRQRVQGQKKGD